MFAYLQGNLAEVNPAYAIIDCMGVGYQVRISLSTYSQIKDMKSLKLLVYSIIKEDSHTLCGFYTQEEKQLFQHLISVSGVGPITALVILSTYSVSDLVSIICSGDAKKIQAVKGIGAKTAQRLIIDIKDKVEKDESLVGVSSQGFSNALPQRDPCISALVISGFSRAASEKVVDSILSQSPDLDLEGVIKQALRML